MTRKENPAVDLVEIENAARIARVTCGWPLPHLTFDFVRPYWRDAHSPAIARRAGIYEYRHYPLDAIRTDLFPAIPRIDLAGRPGEQLRWLSDVRYADETQMNHFGSDPAPDVRTQILADIEMIVDKSTTYKVIGDNALTLVDSTGDPAPLGPVKAPTFQIFLRSRGGEAAFRETVKGLSGRWAQTPGVLRVRRNLFEIPDMEAERAAGYPVKTHPLEMQYQAWIDLVISSEAVAKTLISPSDGIDYADTIAALHAYPTPAAYTFNYRGRPTLAGLRGYAACEAINNMAAEHQRDPRLLGWMYGQMVEDGVFA